MQPKKTEMLTEMIKDLTGANFHQIYKMAVSLYTGFKESDNEGNTEIVNQIADLQEGQWEHLLKRLYTALILDPSTTPQALSQLRENLADSEHERWSRWQIYCHSKLETELDQIQSDREIPSKHHIDFNELPSVIHWNRQIETDYDDLTEKEKDSDRKEADITLEIVKKHTHGSYII